MLDNKPKSSNVKFVSYDGKFPNLCYGTLVLEVGGEQYVFEKSSGLMRSGCGIENYSGDYFSYCGEWQADYLKIPDEIKQFADEIDSCINGNVEHGCCGGYT